MSEELNLGIVPSETSDCNPCGPCGKTDSVKERFPSLTFSGEHATLFRSKYGNCTPGDEYEATFKLKVKSSAMGESEWENRIEFDATAIIGDVVEEEASDEEKNDEAAPKARTLKKSEKSEATEKY